MKARASGDRSPLLAPDSRTSLAQRDQERRSTKPEVDTVVQIRPHPPNLAGLAQLAERRPPKPKVRGSTPWSGASSSRRSQVVEGIWLQTRRRKPASVRIGSSSPASLAQWTRAAGFYPAGRPFESVTRHQFNSPIAQMAERLAVNQEVRGSKPRRGASFSLISRSSVAEHRLDKAQVGGSLPPAGTSLLLGVAQMAARVIWDHEAAGSRPATETTSTLCSNLP